MQLCSFQLAGKKLCYLEAFRGLFFLKWVFPQDQLGDRLEPFLRPQYSALWKVFQIGSILITFNFPY